MNNKRVLILTLAGAAVIALVLFLLREQSYLLMLICFICIYAISVSGLDLLFGYTGQISMGHAAFYAVGAYTSTLLSTNLGAPVWLSAIAACVLSSLAGVLVALPAAKLVRHFLSLLTIAVGQMVYIFVSRADWLTNGMSGIRRIPSFSFFGFQLDTNMRFVVFAILVTAVFLLAKYRIVHSRVGRAFLAIRENITAAGGMGVNVRRYKILAFALSACYTGAAGAMYAHFVGYISPESFQSTQSTLFMTMLLFGGMSNMAGPVVGSAIITLLNESLQGLGSSRMLVYGMVILFIILFLPKGLTGLGTVVGNLLAKRGRGKGRAGA